MSHQTGIQANDVLKKFFVKCQNGKIRSFKVSIENEQLTLADQKSTKKTWEKDYDECVPSMVEENQPSYIFYRLDTKNDLGYEWLLISWCPDTAPVKQKMLYASTKATVKKEFGTSHIKEEIHGTVQNEVTYNGYLKYKKEEKEPAPLTTREEELEVIKRTEVNTYGISSKEQTLRGVAFPLTSDAKQAIVDMAKGNYSYLQFEIDMVNEEIILVCSENIAVEKLPSKVPDNTARYHLFKFKHTHEGDYMENIVFIYSMPGYNCPIRERMLYSSFKANFVDEIIALGIEVVKKLEIDSGAELTEQYLYEEIHPTKNLHRPKFAKPKGPPNRGPKRMTKAQPTE